MIYQINQGHWRQWGRKFINSSHEIKIPVAWNGKQHGYPGPIWCAVRWSRLIHWGKINMIMYQINKTDIENVNNSYAKTNFKLQLHSSKNSIFSVMRLSCKTYVSVILRSLRRGSIVENQLVNVSYVFTVLNDIQFAILSSHKKIIYHFLWWKVYIHGTANSSMHVAWNMNYHVRHKCTIKSGYCAHSSFERIVILTVHVLSDGVAWGKFG